MPRRRCIDASFLMKDFRAPRWLPGGHVQTIWPVFFSRRFDGSAPVFRRERWPTPDGDFIDVDWQGPAAAQPLLVLFHGLEGSSSSHYAQAFAAEAKARGWRFAVPHFRGCSGEINLAPRAYHSGDYEEIGWMLAQLRAGMARTWRSASRSAQRSSALPPSETPTAATGPACRLRMRARIQSISSWSPEW